MVSLGDDEQNAIAVVILRAKSSPLRARSDKLTGAFSISFAIAKRAKLKGRAAWESHCAHRPPATRRLLLEANAEGFNRLTDLLAMIDRSGNRGELLPGAVRAVNRLGSECSTWQPLPTNRATS